MSAPSPTAARKNDHHAHRHARRKPDNKQTLKRGFTTKRDAQMFAIKVEVTKMTGEYIAPSLGKVTVGALGPAWLARQQGREAVRLPVLRKRLARAHRAALGHQPHR
ncbi:MAG: Arm DNA-binding domain-containing protein [Candidatus Sericytochromatia bacterium]